MSEAVAAETPTMDFSPEQNAAIRAVREWHAAWWVQTPKQRAKAAGLHGYADSLPGEEPESSVPQVFKMFGYAGTGKTTIARYLAEQARDHGPVRFAAFTGKAASVLKAKGCEPVSTIHGLIYTLEGEDEDGELIFGRNDRGARGASLIIIDECSMVGEDMGRDLESLGAPILVLGDPAQLPPVKDQGYFTEGEPDVLLTGVHRQAEGSSVLQLATMARCGLALPEGLIGSSYVGAPGQGPRDDFYVQNPDTQVLCWKNATRRHYNQTIRRARGFHTDLPHTGERIICVRNDHDREMLNGTIWVVCSDPEPWPGCDRSFSIDIESEGDGRVVEQVRMHRDRFLPDFNQSRTEGFHQRAFAEEFEFGYAITVHKSQGSEWPDVLIIDESAGVRWVNAKDRGPEYGADQARRWLYTAITRASQRVLIVR